MRQRADPPRGVPFWCASAPAAGAVEAAARRAARARALCRRISRERGRSRARDGCRGPERRPGPRRRRFSRGPPGTKSVAAKARSLARLSPEEFEPLGDWPELSAAAGFLSASGLEHSRGIPTSFGWISTPPAGALSPELRSDPSRCGAPHGPDGSRSHDRHSGFRRDGEPAGPRGRRGRAAVLLRQPRRLRLLSERAARSERAWKRGGRPRPRNERRRNRDVGRPRGSAGRRARRQDRRGESPRRQPLVLGNRAGDLRPGVGEAEPARCARRQPEPGDLRAVLEPLRRRLGAGDGVLAIDRSTQSARHDGLRLVGQ